MTTPAQYQHKLAELDLTALDQPLSNETQPKLEELRNQLHQYEQDVNREMHIIRTQYQPRIDSVNRGGSSRVLTSNKQVSSGRKRAEELERLERERDEKIAPYQAVKDNLMDLLHKVEDALIAAGK